MLIIFNIQTRTAVLFSNFVQRNQLLFIFTAVREFRIEEVIVTIYSVLNNLDHFLHACILRYIRKFLSWNTLGFVSNKCLIIYCPLNFTAYITIYWYYILLLCNNWEILNKTECVLFYDLCQHRYPSNGKLMSLHAIPTDFIRYHLLPITFVLWVENKWHKHNKWWNTSVGCWFMSQIYSVARKGTPHTINLRGLASVHDRTWDRPNSTHVLPPLTRT